MNFISKGSQVEVVPTCIYLGIVVFCPYLLQSTAAEAQVSKGYAAFTTLERKCNPQESGLLASSQVIGLVLTLRPGFKFLSGYDCKYVLVNI